MSAFPLHGKVMKLGEGMLKTYTVLGSFTKVSGAEFVVCEDQFARVQIFKPDLLVLIEEKKQ